MNAPSYSLTEILEWCQAMRENAMNRARDFEQAGLPFSPHTAAEEAARFDSALWYLRRAPR